LADLRERFLKLNLELHKDKTRLIQFGRFAAQNRKSQGKGKPGTFDFLGFTHISGKTENGKFMVLRSTIRLCKIVELKIKAIIVRSGSNFEAVYSIITFGNRHARRPIYQ
jgi:RNA-directed DNA polymerase